MKLKVVIDTSSKTLWDVNSHYLKKILLTLKKQIICNDYRLHTYHLPISKRKFVTRPSL